MKPENSRKFIKFEELIARFIDLFLFIACFIFFLVGGIAIWNHFHSPSYIQSGRLEEAREKMDDVSHGRS